jgi:hypothetical protein
MAFNTDITPGSPPLLWSNLKTAFDQINENFESIQITLGGSGLTPLAFDSLDSSVSPAYTNTHQLGEATKAWKSVYINQYENVSGSEDNGLWLGTAQIKSTNGIVDLPNGTTINGSLIIDPDKTFFKSINVNDESSIEATVFGDTVNFNAGTAIQLTVNSGADRITIENTGVTEIANGDGIVISDSTGSITIENSGVLSIAAGSGIGVSGSTGDITITNNGIRGLTAGIGINVYVDPTTKIAEVTNSSPASSLAVFRSVAVTGTTGQTPLLADNTADTLTLNAGYGLILTTDEPNDRVTFTLDQNVDITGSVFADDSTTLLVDATNAQIVGPISSTDTHGNSITMSSAYGVVIGGTGGASVIGAATAPVWIGAGPSGSTSGTVTIGHGTNSVIVNGTLSATLSGNVTGNLTGNADTATVGTTVTLTATNSTNATHFITFVDTATGNEAVRTDVGLTYNPSTNTLATDKFSGNIATNFIDSADSSAITIEAPVIFNTDVVMENELTVNGNIIGYIRLATLKSVVAASTDFANFQTRIAALV